MKHFTDSIFYSIEQIARYIEINGKEFFAKLTTEITPEEYRTIDVIMCNPDICQRDLAKLILRDRVRTGRILDSLEGKGLIHRFSDVRNKRLVKKMSLTELGQKYHTEVSQKLYPYLAEFYEKFTASQLDELKKLLGLLENAISSVTKVQA
ncbi:MAG: MarR family transcriptional regulator [bacterium]|nr:MarR family transcriptional regulator [bacterium]